MRIHYATGDLIPESYRLKSDFKVNTGVLTETFERTLSMTASLILEGMDVWVAVCRFGDTGMYAGIRPIEGGYLLIISISRWLQILDHHPESGRVLLEGILIHEKEHLKQLEEGRLLLDPEVRGIRWLGEARPIRRSGLAYFNQPWEREAFNAEAQYLVRRGVFASYHQALAFLRQTRT